MPVMNGKSNSVVGHASRIRERVLPCLRYSHKLSGYREACPTISKQSETGEVAS